MNEISKYNQEIQSFLIDEDFVRLTCEQIEKDLGGLYPGEVDLKLSGEQAPIDELKRAVSDILHNLSKYSSHSLTQFLYKVDLPESEFRKTLNGEDDFDNLALKIIRREAQKVYLRKRFS